MKCMRAMLNVIMDGIRDAGMLLDYAEAAEQDDTKHWFLERAERRIKCLKSDYETVLDMTGLREKAEAGDELATVLHEHIEEETDRLERRSERLAG